MLNLESHLSSLDRSLADLRHALASPPGSLRRGQATEVASNLVRDAGAVAALFVHRCVSPHTVPTGHGGPSKGRKEA
jgi:hypothetical protein